MRLQIEVHEEDIGPLRMLMWRDHRSRIHDEAAYLLAVKIREELARLEANTVATSDVAL